jgi:hypothetical protein
MKNRAKLSLVAAIQVSVKVRRPNYIPMTHKISLAGCECDGASYSFPKPKPAK